METCKRGRWRFDEKTGEIVEDKPQDEAVEQDPETKPNPERSRAMNPGGYL